MHIPIFLLLFAILSASAQNNTNSLPNLDLTKTTSKERFQQLVFTTPAYRKEALRLIIGEANRVAKELNLLEQLPIVDTNLVAAYIPSPRMVQRLGGAFGNITTSNYIYYVSVGNKFSFLEQAHLEQGNNQLRKQYVWTMEKIDTNGACQLAMQFLSAASMDVIALNRDCNIHIETFMPEGESGKHFVPIYGVHWMSKKPEVRGSVAEVELILPTKIIRKMRVNQSEYILRKPLEIPNLDFLLSQTNASVVATNAPPPP